MLGNPRCRILIVGLALAGLPGSAAASGPPLQPDSSPPPGVTVTSTGIARLKPPARLSERTIRVAFDAAHRVAVTRAIKQARARSDAIAKAGGLTLGDIVAAADADLPYFREFGAERFCRRARSRRGGRRRLRCRAPEFAAASVRVTSSLGPATVAERTVTSSGEGEARVTPRNRRGSFSIRQAVLDARLQAAPLALAAARERATSLAASAGLRLGRPIAVSDGAPLFDPYGTDALGTFGIGRYCGRVRRPIFRRRRGSSRRRLVGFRHSRRVCRVPRVEEVSLQVTFAAS